MDSVNDASKDEESFAIMYFPGLGSDEDEPNKLRFRIDRPKKIELELARHVQKCFGRNRYKFVMVDNIYPYIIWTFDENVKLRISNPSETTITSRGVYAERCVNDGKLAAIEAYKVPKENASIIYSESIFGEQHIAERHGFSTHVRIF